MEKVRNDHFSGEQGVEYRPIPSRPGYFAGSDGSIWSFFHNRPLKRKFGSAADRRLIVTFCTSPRTMSVARLVLEAFVGPCPEGMECCHGPGGCEDNRPSNLRWDTRQSNIEDIYRFGEANCPKGERNAKSKLTEEGVKTIMRMRQEGARSRDILKALGIKHNALSKVLLGLTWNHVTGIPKKVDNHRLKSRKVATSVVR